MTHEHTTFNKSEINNHFLKLNILLVIYKNIKKSYN